MTKNYSVSIMCRENSMSTKLLHAYLINNNINTIIVTDNPSDHIYYSDEELILQNFNNITLHTEKHPTAWDKAFYHIYKNNLKYDYYYFIEDDVSCVNLQIFLKLFQTLVNYNNDLIATQIKSQIEDPFWDNWYIKNLFNRAYKGVDDKILYRSFNPFCRISNKLINKIFEFYDEYHRLYFHEIMIPTLCVKNKLTYIDFKKNKELKQFFGPFNYVGPELKFLTKNYFYNKISHPRYVGEKWRR